MCLGYLRFLGSKPLGNVQISNVEDIRPFLLHFFSPSSSAINRLVTSKMIRPFPKSQNTVNVTLIGKRVFVCVIKDLEMRRLSWISCMCLKKSKRCPYEIQKRRHRDIGRGGSNETRVIEIRVK